MSRFSVLTDLGSRIYLVLDSSCLEFRVEIEMGARHFSRPSRDLLMPRLSRLLPQPLIDRFAGQGRGGRHLSPLRFCTQLGIGVIRQGQMKSLHGLFFVLNMPPG
jgi:hypothetical protein